MTLTGFLNRLSDAMPDEFSSSRRDAYLAILDPQEMRQPKELLGPTAEPNPVDFGTIKDARGLRRTAS
jgi:hypothetical protein